MPSMLIPVMLSTGLIGCSRYWVSEGGPLAPGGVDVAFIDDPQVGA